MGDHDMDPIEVAGLVRDAHKSGQLAKRRAVVPLERRIRALEEALAELHKAVKAQRGRWAHPHLDSNRKWLERQDEVNVMNALSKAQATLETEDEQTNTT